MTQRKRHGVALRSSAGVALWLFALAALTSGCGDTSEDDSSSQTPATGGSSSTGGTFATGGTGTGGASNTGGLTSSGGTSTGGGSGGVQTNSGGSTATGGSTAITCPTTPLSPGDTTRSVNVGGKSRSYILHVPATYNGNAPAPLVVDFHPLSGSGSGERSTSPYPAQTDPDGVVMAFPTGEAGPSGNAWNVGPCCVSNVDDVAFARALVEDVQQAACIDPKRVYAVGFSMGGGMSHYLACHAADLFAAVAPAAFDLLKENVDDCTPSRPITVVSFRGTDDQLVLYDGGYSPVVSGMPITFLGAEKTFQTWAELNQCTSPASPKDGNGCSSYSGCQGDVDVVLCTQQGAGHVAGNASIAWPILKQHSLP